MSNNEDKTAREAVSPKKRGDAAYKKICGTPDWTPEPTADGEVYLGPDFGQQHVGGLVHLVLFLLRMFRLRTSISRNIVRKLLMLDLSVPVEAWA